MPANDRKIANTEEEDLAGRRLGEGFGAVQVWVRPHHLPKLFSLQHCPQRALPTETKVESGMSQSKSGTSVNLSNSG